jgi:hypothetical protein
MMIFYDEPFTGQDPISMGVLVKLIHDLNQELGLTSIVVSHDVKETFLIADRVVFIAVPHRGSKLADIGLVQLAVRLIKLPTDTLGFITRAVTTGGLQFINPELHRYRQLGLRSVDMLSPEHPYFAALERCPVTVPCHSIIGDRGKGPGPKCSDGVVPYESAHLPSAVSEVLVPHWHGCVEKPETVAEVLRILREHLRG